MLLGRLSNAIVVGISGEMIRKKVTKKYLDTCFIIIDSAAVHLSEIAKLNLSMLEEKKKEGDK